MLTLLSVVDALAEELLWHYLVLAGHELVDCCLVVKEQFHPAHHEVDNDESDEQ